jgi:hypothetical protein
MGIAPGCQSGARGPLDFARPGVASYVALGGAPGVTSDLASGVTSDVASDVAGYMAPDRLV